MGATRPDVVSEARALAKFIHAEKLTQIDGDGASLWEGYIRDHLDHMRVLATGDEPSFKSICSHLYQTPLTHGFGQSSVHFTRLRDTPASRAYSAAMIIDKLHRLCEAVGVLNVVSPEHVADYSRDVGKFDDLLDAVEERLGIDISPPSVDGSLYGIVNRRGIFCERHFDSMYVAHRLANLDVRSCVEIGGGSGYVAFFARRYGVKTYSIVDLPTVSATQYLILGGSLGAGEVGLFPDQNQPITLVPSTAPDQVDWSVDCVLNVDSLPEMPPSVGQMYLNFARKAGMVLSINQESRVSNGEERQHSVSELAEKDFNRESRVPYWMRTGWVEEIYRPA
ncbi:MAG: hypothetical protein AAF231_01085 [Pseudomonadota bacterium]